MNILEYETTQELKSHGQDNFPFNIYLCSIPLDFAAIPLHWHNDMEIIYIKKGRGCIRVNLSPFLVQEGDIVIVLPGQLHSIEQYENFSMEYENIIFQLSMLMTAQKDTCTSNFFEPLLQQKITLPNLCSTSCENYGILSGCLDALDEICRTASPGYHMAVKGQLFSFFFGLISSLSAPLTVHQDKSLDRLKELLKHVETNYGQKITVDNAAAICGFSKSHFMKFFKHTMGISFIEYLNDYRLIMAARLLATSSDSVVSISEETGFENLSYFNRIFKRKFGCTPTQLRKRE